MDKPHPQPARGSTASPGRRPTPGLGRLRTVAGVLVLGLAVWWLWDLVDTAEVTRAGAAVLAAPLATVGALLAYAAAFGLRTVVWTRMQPALPSGQAWAALHVALAANHVLPLRLGEVLRVTSVLRRTALSARPVIAAVALLRLGDLMALVVIAAVATPVALVAVVGGAGAVVVALVCAVAVLGAGWWCVRVARATSATGSRALRSPDGWVAVGTVSAWLLEAVVLWVVAGTAGVGLSLPEAAGVTAITVFAQVLAVTPGGVGTYEAAGTAALLALGVGAPEAFAVVLLTHAVKTAYSLALGAVALFAPAPGYWGGWRLPRTVPPRATIADPAPDDDAPVVVFLPAHDEEQVIASVIRRIPTAVAGRGVQVLVIDDGSSDATAQEARGAGAEVLSLGHNQGLGAAVRRGLAEAAARAPAAGVYLDADGEYPPEEIPAVVAPVLRGEADYVIGSRFAGRIDSMRPHRRLGNLVLTRWLRWTARRRDLTDGQSGFRAFSPAALGEAEVVHDYNYAQVLTLDLLAKGYRYAEVPISYAFRTTGTSFVSLGRYLRKVVPAVHRELNGAAR